MFRSAHCSIFFVLRKGKQKNSFLFCFLFTATNSSFFPFHCNASTLGPSSPTPGHKPRGNKYLKDMGTPAISAQQGTIVKSGKQAECRNYRWMETGDGHMNTMQYFSRMRKQEIMPSSATGDKVATIIPSEVGRQGETSIICYHL